MKKEFNIDGYSLQAVTEGVQDLEIAVHKFKTETRVKLEHLYCAVDVKSFGVEDTEGIKIQLHNLGRSIENIELWFSLMEMLLENMQSDLRTISVVQKITNETTRSRKLAEEREQKKEEKREYDRKHIAEKRSANKVAPDK